MGNNRLYIRDRNTGATLFLATSNAPSGWQLVCSGDEISAWIGARDHQAQNDDAVPTGLEFVDERMHEGTVVPPPAGWACEESSIVNADDTAALSLADACTLRVEGEGVGADCFTRDIPLAAIEALTGRRLVPRLSTEPGYDPTDTGGVPRCYVEQQLGRFAKAEGFELDPVMVDAITHSLSDGLAIPQDWRTCDVVVKMALAWLGGEHYIKTLHDKRRTMLPPVDPALQPVIDALPADEREMWDDACRGADHLMLLNGPELYATGRSLLQRGLPLELVQLGEASFFPGMRAVRRALPVQREVDLVDAMSELAPAAREWTVLVNQIAQRSGEPPPTKAEQILDMHETFIMMAPRTRERALDRGRLLTNLVQRIRDIACDTDGLYEEVVAEYDAAAVHLGLKPTKGYEGQSSADAHAFRHAAEAAQRNGLHRDITAALVAAANALNESPEADTVIADENPTP